MWVMVILVTRDATESPPFKTMFDDDDPLVRAMSLPPLTEYVAVPVVNAGDKLMLRAESSARILKYPGLISAHSVGDDEHIADSSGI